MTAQPLATTAVPAFPGPRAAPARSVCRRTTTLAAAIALGLASALIAPTVQGAEPPPSIDPWEALTDHFRQGMRPFGPRQVIVAFGVLISLGLAAWWLAYYLARRPPPSADRPLALFRELCLGQGLSWPESILLWRLARSRDVAEPARLFVEPEHFDPATLPAALHGEAPRLEQLRQRLFADPTSGELIAGQNSDEESSSVAVASGLSPLLAPPRPPALDVPPWPHS